VYKRQPQGPSRSIRMRRPGRKAPGSPSRSPPKARPDRQWLPNGAARS